jgi:peptidoglycan hydrolase-like protein with peptidoglycan-binding domain
MKHTALILLVTLPIAAFAPAVNAEASTERNLASFNVADLAYKGRFIENGIPSYGSLEASVDSGSITAEDVIQSAIAHSISSQQTSSVLIATAYTDLTLPTLRQGDRGRDVELLQRILQDNGFLGAAGVRLGNPRGAIVDGIFGAVTASAIRDLQQRYGIPVTGQVNPTTWEVLDTHENPYRSPLPWK